MKCILCHIPMKKFLYKNWYWIYRCPVCHLGETDLKKEYSLFVKEFYSQGYYEGDPTRSAYESYERDKPMIIRNMMKFLSFIRSKHSIGKLLDVGCAFGYFVDYACKEGYEAYGFDASHFAASEAARLIGTSKIKEGTIEKVNYPKNSFDVITLFDVFEHLQDPLNDMKKLAGLLKKDGVMLIATGDTRSIAAKVFRRRWTFYIPPQHIFFFHRKNVRVLLRRAGLKPRAWHSVGKWLSFGYVLHLARTTGENPIAGWIHDQIKHTPLMRIPLYVPMKDNMVIEVVKL